MARCPFYPFKRRIGVMGGSFNPAHNGHLYVADKACRAANLDEIWWLISPQNPLKSKKNMSSFDHRLADARQLAGRHHAIKCLDIEQSRGFRLTFDTLSYLKKICPRAHLIWIMGADNLIEFPQWMHARAIARLVPIMIMNRASYRYKALSSKGAALLGRRRRTSSAAQLNHRRKGWCFFHAANNNLSATALRADQESQLASNNKSG